MVSVGSEVATRSKAAARIGLGCVLAVLLFGCSDDESARTPDSTAKTEMRGSDHDHHLSADAQHPGADSPAMVETESPDYQPVTAASDGLEIEGAYLRQPAPGQSMLAAFVTFRNGSDHAYALVDVVSSQAGSISIHRTIYDKGIMSMRPVADLVIPPRTELVFKPGGYHLMLSDVEGNLEPGGQIPLIFNFAGGVSVEVTAEVRAIH